MGKKKEVVEQEYDDAVDGSFEKVPSAEAVAPDEEPKEEKVSKADLNKEKLEKIFAEERRIKEEWASKLQNIKLIKNSAFFVAEQHIRMVAMGLSYGCIIVGKGGLSKTHLTLGILKEMNVPFEHLDSYSSSASFYGWVYQNRRKILFIDDVEGLLDDKRAVAYLKAMTDTYKNRMVKNIIARQQKDKYGEYVPEEFFFEGGIIIATNELKKNKHIKALLTRIREINLNLTYRQKISIMEEIIQTEDELFPKLNIHHRREVFEFIKENTDEQTYDLNFRTLKLMYGYYAYSLAINDMTMWMNLGKLLLKSGDSFFIIKELETNPAFKDLSREEKSKTYIEITGKSRNTYFRDFDKYQAEMGEAEEKESAREILEKMAKKDADKKAESSEPSSESVPVESPLVEEYKDE